MKTGNPKKQSAARSRPKRSGHCDVIMPIGQTYIRNESVTPAIYTFFSVRDSSSLSFAFGTMSVTASDWIKGISLSIMASIIGGGSKLAIRKSWLMELSLTETPDDCNRSNMADGLVTMDNTTTSSSVRQAFPDSNNNNNKKKKKERTLCWAHFLRFLGMVGMTFLNPLCGVLAMNYASPSILAPFSGLTLVWIVLFSKHLIDEEPSRSQIVAAGLIVLGEVVVAIFGDHTNEDGATLASLVRERERERENTI